MVGLEIRPLAGDEDHACDLAVKQHVHVLRLALRRALRVAEDGGETPRLRACLHRLRQGGKNRVLELWHEQADGAGQRAVTGRQVHQFSHRALNTLARLGRTACEPVATREAVATLTPARSATSRRVDIGRV